MSGKEGFSKKMIFLESPSCDPYLNLALEEYLFEQFPKSENYLMLWQNDNAVIIGKYQNAAAEINTDFVREHGIKVVRRLSGGGAVYHDLGNVNYTFIADAADPGALDMRSFCLPLVKILNRLGVPAEISGRNDITIRGMKCSGNAEYVKQGRIMHHGTLLFDSDLTVISGALNVRPEKYRSKGIPSVRSRVTNIRPFLKEDTDVRGFKEILRRYLTEGSKTLERRDFAETDLRAASEIASSRYATWEWNFGRSPKYTVTKTRYFEGCGFIELFLTVEKDGILSDFTSRGDYFSVADDQQELRRRLIGTKLRKNDLLEALKGLDIDKYYSGLETGQFIELLLE